MAALRPALKSLTDRGLLQLPSTNCDEVMLKLADKEADFLQGRLALETS